MSEPISATKPDSFRPEKIFHAILTVDKEKFPKENEPWSLSFIIKKPLEEPQSIPPGDEAKVIEFAIERANAQALAPLTTVPSPFDIAVDRPCWVVVELDAGIENWQFAKDVYGVTNKTKSDRNCWLRHVYGSGAQPAGEPIPDDKCRVLYFGVVARGEKDTPDASDFFNFHTEFIMKEFDDQKRPVEKRLNVIFDPDVKNEGTKFPP